jgi:hypothetical protein
MPHAAGCPKPQMSKVNAMTVTELRMELDERTKLAAKYPQWHLWVSSSNRPWATRIGNVTPPVGHDQKQDPRWRMTIDANTWPELEEVLKQQTELDTRVLSIAAGRKPL